MFALGELGLDGGREASKDGKGQMKAAVLTARSAKVNDVESGSLIRGLEELGYEVSREPGYADLYVLNTCAVTAEAERKSRQAVGRALKYNPAAKVVVCGCASQKSPARVWPGKPNVHRRGGGRGERAKFSTSRRRASPTSSAGCLWTKGRELMTNCPSPSA